MIKTKSVKDMIEIILNKNPEIATQEDLDKIDSLFFKDDLERPEQDFSISDIQYFPNLKSISIKNHLITQEDINEILNSNISEIEFEDCILDDNVGFTENDKVESIEFVKSSVDNYSFLNCFKKLKKLSVFKPQNNRLFNVKDIEFNKELKTLILHDVVVSNIELLNDKEIEMLSLLKSSLSSNYVDSINQMKQLKKVYISEEYNNSSISSQIDVRNNLNDLVSGSEDSV